MYRYALSTVYKKKHSTGHDRGSSYYNGTFKIFDDNGEAQVSQNVTPTKVYDRTQEFKMFDYSIGTTNTIVFKAENIQTGDKGAENIDEEHDRSPCGYEVTFKDYVALTYYQEK